jgi:glycosyltransferase involved in cell wall biosynthesis
MIVAFDTLLLSERYRHSGIHEYAKNLFREFRRLLTESDSIAFRHFVSRGHADDSLDWHSTAGCRAVATSLLRFRRIWQLGAGSIAASAAGADMIFAPGPAIVPSPVIPVTVTIHDAMPAKLPSSIIPKSAVARSTAWLAAKWSQRVITDSESSKRDLIEVYRLPPEKVSVVYLGYDRETFNADPPDAIQRHQLLGSLGIREPYILHHGTVQHRKNIARLIRAYRIFTSRNPAIDVQLVLAGGLGWGAEDIREQARRGMGPDQIVFTGPLTANDLSIVLKSASLSVIPSLYEGFCLPLVESMACGVPTIASNSSCIPEISAGKLRYFDPYSSEEMAEQIERALTDAELRRELRERGLARASDFSWQRCAEETLGVLAQAVAT